MVILTFDIEEWYHILDDEFAENMSLWEERESRVEQTTYKILELLEDCKILATFFIVGWVAKKHKKLIRDIVDSGHEIGSHSYAHKLIFKESKEYFINDLNKSINILQDISGKKVEMYRAPGFSIKKEQLLWFFEALINAGIKIDCSIFPTTRYHGGIREFPCDKPCIIKIGDYRIFELPVNVMKLPILNIGLTFIGGGYFRLLPFWMIKWLVRRNIDYVITYFHPRDFDLQQPRLPHFSVMRKFRLYYGIKSALQKLKLLLNMFEITTVGAFVKSYQWKDAPIIEVV